jgi:uncharacterized membrane protein
MTIDSIPRPIRPTRPNKPIRPVQPIKTINNENSSEKIINNESDKIQRHSHRLLNNLYAMHLFSGFSFGVSGLVAMILNYLLSENELNSFYYNHHIYMIKTAWFGWAWIALGWFIWWMGIHWLAGFIWLAATIWYAQRLIRAWFCLRDNREP